MSKAVMISIRPKWCEKIARGEKTIEVRKNRPKIETPFKCYIYCTANGITAAERDRNIFTDLRCKVIGEFVCDSIVELAPINRAPDNLEDLACQTREQIVEYIKGRGYGWHISNLVIYDRPFELRQFVTKGICDCTNCKKCFWFAPGDGCNVDDDCDLDYEYLSAGTNVKPLFRPPQSWCYVEEVQGNG